MRRIAMTAVLIVSLATAGATAKPDRKPPKPKPELELLTRNQEGALQHKAIKASVRSRRGREARVKGTLFVDGFPDDYYFRLEPRTKRLKGNDAAFSFPLSARKREVLDFAAQTCRPASVTLSVRVGRGSDSLSERLKKPGDC